MVPHVKILGWLHVIFGILGIAAGVIVMVIFGGIAGIVGATGAPDDRVLAIPILGGIGGIIFLVLVVLSLPSLIAGIGLIQFRPWARIVMIVLSALHLLNIPFGTALGIYGLWVLLNRETEILFQRPMMPYPQPPYPQQPPYRP